MSNLFKTITNHYQQTLYGKNKKAITALKDKNITSQKTLEAFKIGYSATDLKEIADRKMTKELSETGLLALTGRNFFKNSFVVPLYNMEGEIVNFYSQSLLQSNASKFLYDGVKGISNHSVLKTESDVIITNLLYFALECHHAGYHNVIFCPMREAAEMLPARKYTVLTMRYSHLLAKHLVNAGEIYTTAHTATTPFEKTFANKKEFTPDSLKKNSSPILDKVVSDLDDLGYVGECENKKLAYLVAVSRKLNKPLSAIIVSSSGAGKTGLMRAVSELVPKEDKMMLSRLTPQALFHMPKNALMEKLIVVDERNGSSLADYSIRTMQTSNELTLARPKAKDEDSAIKSIAVKCSYMESTTSQDINPENASRCFILHLDESASSTRAILESQRKALGCQPIVDKKSILEWHHRFQRSLKSLPVVIPFVEHIHFPYHQVTFRREQQKFLSLIEVIALVNQNEREIKEDAIIADVQDYATAYELFIQIFDDQQKEVSRNAQELLQIFEDEVYLKFTMRQALSFSGWSYGKLHRTIKELLKFEYIAASTNKKGKHAINYTVLDYKPYLQSNRKLTHPDELSTIYPSTIQQLSANNPEGGNEDLIFVNGAENGKEHPTIHRRL